MDIIYQKATHAISALVSRHWQNERSIMRAAQVIYVRDFLSSNISFKNIFWTRGSEKYCQANSSMNLDDHLSWSWYLTKGKASARKNFKCTSMIFKIGAWIVKGQLEMMIVSWEVLNEKWNDCQR